MDRRERIIKMAQDEFPGSAVTFEDFGPFIKFKIEDGSGNLLSTSFPHFLPIEIDYWPEERLRKVIRQTCGS